MKRKMVPKCHSAPTELEPAPVLVGTVAPANTSVSGPTTTPVADAASAEAKMAAEGDAPEHESELGSIWDAEAIVKWICDQPDNPRHYAPMIKSILKTATRLPPLLASLNVSASEDALDKRKTAEMPREGKK